MPLRSLRNCPAELASELDRIQSAAWAVHAITAAAIGPVLEQASEQGITVVVYKGAAQAARYYKQPWTRSMADVDLLVRDDQKERLYEILAARNFRGRFTPGRVLTERVSHERSFVPPTPGARVLDIHTSPTPPARYRLPVDDMIARSVPGTLFDAPVRFLTAEDELLVMAVNQAYDHFRMGFVRYLDAWLISSRLVVDWKSLVKVAQLAGAATTTWLTLSNAKRVAGVDVPAEVLDEIEPSLVRRGWLRALLDTGGWGDPRFVLPRRIEQLLLVYPVIDRPLTFVGFLTHHGRLRLLDAFQVLSEKVRGPGDTRDVMDGAASSPRSFVKVPFG